MRLIDADALKKQYYPFPCAIGVENAVTIRAINDAPTIDALPVVRGEWINKPKTCVFICSMCGREVKTFHTNDIKVVNDEYPFCHCGAKMESEGGT